MLLFGFLIIGWVPFARPVFPHIADGMPTLAPIVREVTPSIVNISVRGRIKEENPLYRDPLFREFFDLPKQIEHEFQAAGSGVIVDAAHGYVLTANHVVAQIASAQVTTKDGQRFVARLVGRDPATDVAVLQVQVLLASSRSRSATATRSKSATSCLRSAIHSVSARQSRRGSSVRSAAQASVSKAMRISFRAMRRSILAIPVAR